MNERKSRKTDQALNEAVDRFAHYMKAKLLENRHKGGRGNWLADKPRDLMKRLKEETRELNIAIALASVRCHESARTRRQHALHVAREAADVANFAMMLADWHWHLYQSEERSKGQA